MSIRVEGHHYHHLAITSPLNHESSGRFINSCLSVYPL
jgi:hypothetical protein